MHNTRYYNKIQRQSRVVTVASPWLMSSDARRAAGLMHVKSVKAQNPLATRGLLATDHIILNHSQVTWTTPELAPPLLTITSHQREDVSALDRFNVHRCPTRHSPEEGPDCPECARMKTV
ncbi:uncharacterized protein TNCV_2297371 [Trichonephila clavipes]|nr:uncharacterized protein TNCV_2297371 [Trichonephila clavipes]